MSLEVIRKITGFIFSFFYRTEITGLENVPREGGALLCSNHLSNLDPLLLGYKLGRNIRWLAKKELFRYRVIAYFVKKSGAVPVDRDKGGSGAVEAAVELLKQGEITGIFPEGTRLLRNKKRKQRIHAGAAIIAEKSRCPVIPVRIITDYKLFGRIRVVFGKAFYYEYGFVTKQNNDFEPESEQVQYDEYIKMSKKIMDFVNSLN